MKTTYGSSLLGPFQLIQPEEGNVIMVVLPKTGDVNAISVDFLREHPVGYIGSDIPDAPSHRKDNFVRRKGDGLDASRGIAERYLGLWKKSICSTWMKWQSQKEVMQVPKGCLGHY